MTKEIKLREAKHSHQPRAFFSMLLSIFIVIVVFAGTFAWLSASRRVDGSGDISSMESDGSLFIALGNVVNNTDNYDDISVVGSFTGNLYPISTPDLSNWWYVSSWDKHQAENYQKANLTQDNVNKDRWNYTYKEKQYTAFNKVDYTVFCSGDKSMDVYFDVNAIQLFESLDEHQNPKRLKEAVRVGIAINGAMKLIYAPVIETGKGNSKNTSEAKYYSVNSATTVVENSNVYDDLSNWTAIQDNETGIYSATDKTMLFTTNHDGTLVSVYIWIEGTDAQAMIGKSDNANGISVSVDLVGIPTE